MRDWCILGFLILGLFIWGLGNLGSTMGEWVNERWIMNDKLFGRQHVLPNRLIGDALSLYRL